MAEDRGQRAEGGRGLGKAKRRTKALEAEGSKINAENAKAKV